MAHHGMKLRGWKGRDRAGPYIFFFQAEDGIRYLTVTGVQTCALPISGQLMRGAGQFSDRFVRERDQSVVEEDRLDVPDPLPLDVDVLVACVLLRRTLRFIEDRKSVV